MYQLLRERRSHGDRTHLTQHSQDASTQLFSASDGETKNGDSIAYTSDIRKNLHNDDGWWK
jgi:hypothetical protein